MRIRKRNRWLRVLNYSFYDLPCPINLNCFWSFGSLLGLFLVIQIVSGFLMSCHYVAAGDLAFGSVIHIQRDVNSGWVLRNVHSNGASFIIAFIYIHLARGIYYSSYSRLLAVWNTGLILLLMTMASAFFGYVLPWGQMSYWGATVITNMFSVVPFIGPSIVELLWGGYTVGAPTLNRFYSFHFILPLVMVMVVLVHLIFLHDKGSSNPLGADSDYDFLNVPFYPHYFWADMIAASAGMMVFSVFVLLYPHLLGCPENFEPANPMKTPVHIQPEWYFLPLYAMLRSIPHKLGGIVVMVSAMVILVFLPYICRSRMMGLPNYFLREVLWWSFTVNWVCLGWLGSCPAEYPYISLAGFHTFFYFFYFLADFFLIRLLDPPCYLDCKSGAQALAVSRYYRAKKILYVDAERPHVSIWEHVSGVGFWDWWYQLKIAEMEEKYKKGSVTQRYTFMSREEAVKWTYNDGFRG